MADHDDGEDSFLDDDLDDLPHNALEELERNAIQFTQAQIKTNRSSDYGDDFEDEDLDDAVVIDEAQGGPAAFPVLQRNHPGQTTQLEDFRHQRHGTVSSLANRQQYNVPPLSSYGAYSPLSTRHQQQAPRQPPLFHPPKPPQQVVQHDSVMVDQSSYAAGGVDDKLDSLQRQVEELLKERNALKQDLNAKAGEIAIVRSKQEKTAKEYERELNATKKLHADQLAKQQKAIEAARIAEKSAATERDFIRQDLAEESERVRRLNRAREAERAGAVGPVTTPKKKKLLHRDGFDDDELEVLSPSKISPSKFQKRITSSPSKLGGKRKRKSADSPIRALEVMQIDEPPAQDSAHQNIPMLDAAMVEKLGRRDDRFDFLGTMIGHRPNRHHLRTLEELGKHTLPSTPNESLSSMILGKIPTMGIKRSPSDLPIDFCELLISVWSQCMTEKYLKPVYLFIDMLTAALESKTLSVAPHIIDSLVPLVQLTGDLVAIPRFNSKSADPFDKDIDVSACLALLHLAALGCMAETQHITRFWKLMRWDFVLLILSQNQPTADFEMMLRLLSTSVLKDSFGTISADDNIQNDHVGYIIDRLTWPLFETLCLPMSTDKLDVATLVKLRLHILQLLIGMTRSPNAALALAQHQNAIARIVSLMSDEIDALYDYNAGHEESAQLISLATRLLYHLTTKYDHAINMQKKLAAINGGFQKYIICLARLNFSEEDLVLESGIDSDVAQCALEMLELAVTPDEGETIHAAFSSQ